MEENKYSVEGGGKGLLLLIQSPCDTKSGYGYHSKDIIKSLFKIFPEADFKFIVLRWGNTPWGSLDINDPIEKRIIDNILRAPNLPRKPDYFFQISVPNEFRPVGNFNVGITAGMETTAISVPWIEGGNRMDLVIVPSKHSRDVFLTSQWDHKNPHTGQVDKIYKFKKPIETLFEGVDTNIYKQTKEILPSVDKQLKIISEKFNFLFVGHWLNGSLGNDRKNVGMLIKVFLETFADFDEKPGLILKTSHFTPSIIDREELLGRIENIRELVIKESPRLKGQLPNIYLLHGDLTDNEMNSLYNHSKVKSFITFTRGEGYGRPMAEFSATGKPLMATKCSGHVDFMSPSGAIFLNGKNEKVDQSAIWKDVIIPESQWFTVDNNEASIKMKNVFKDYGNYLNRGRMQKNNVVKNFSLDKMTESFKLILDKYLMNVPKETEIKLPKLKKIGDSSPSTTLSQTKNEIKFPNLKKV